MSTEKSTILDLYDSIDKKNWKVDKSLKKILSLVNENRYNTLEVSSIIWNLDNLSNFILAVLIIDNHSNIKTISEKIIGCDGEARLKVYEQDAFRRKVERCVKKLVEKKLIEISDKKHVKNFKKEHPVYRLSINGIFYSILNWYHEAFLNINFLDVNPKSMVHNLVKNYPDCPLFGYYVFAHFDEKTIANSTIELDEILLEYLYDICIVFIKIKRLFEDSTIGGKVPEYFFSWPLSANNKGKFIREDFGKGSKFRRFLFRELGWDWIYEAQVEPNFYDNQITIKSSKLVTDAYIKININRLTVRLNYGKRNYSSFMVTIGSDEKKPTYLTVYCKSNNRQREIIERELHYSVHLCIVEMIFLIISKQNENHILLELLKKDKKFQAMCNILIKKLEIFKH